VEGRLVGGGGGAFGFFGLRLLDGSKRMEGGVLFERRGSLGNCGADIGGVSLVMSGIFGRWLRDESKE
jgi:hypothetical protein